VKYNSHTIIYAYNNYYLIPFNLIIYHTDTHTHSHSHSELLLVLIIAIMILVVIASVNVILRNQQ